MATDTVDVSAFPVDVALGAGAVWVISNDDTNIDSELSRIAPPTPRN